MSDVLDAAAPVGPDAAAALLWMSELCLDDAGTTWGSTAAEFQMSNASAILDLACGWRQFFVPGVRGSRKTTDLAAIALAVLALQAPPLSRSFIIGQDEDQAADMVTLAGEMIARTPGLDALFTTTGLQIKNIRTGATFTALANDPSAMGKRPYMIVADELAAWPDSKPAKKFWTAMVTAVEKVPNCRLVVLTNAGSPDHWAYKRYEIAQTSKHWKVLDVPAPLPWLDAPALERARENCLTQAEFDRLFLNIWTSEDSRLTTPEQIRACITQRPRPMRPVPGVRYVAGLDLGWVNDPTVLVLAHLEPRKQRWAGQDWKDIPDGRPMMPPDDYLWTVVVDLIEVWQGSRANPVQIAEVASRAGDVCAAYGATLVFDPREFVDGSQRLRRQGVLAEEFHFSAPSKALLAATMIRLIHEQALDLPDDAELIDELVHVNLIENSTGMLRLDHDPGRHDDRAIALALAGQHLLAGTQAEIAALKGRQRLVPGTRWGHLPSRGDDRGDGAALLRRLGQMGDRAAVRLLTPEPPRRWR
ncbi:MAG: phage terminase-like protein large subunit-like protein [Frankiales bacterium]|nr:phage terminase-like protein large subunit-like protein [Frankiales bacterium]